LGFLELLNVKLKSEIVTAADLAGQTHLQSLDDSSQGTHHQNNFKLLIVNRNKLEIFTNMLKTENKSA